MREVATDGQEVGAQPGVGKSSRGSLDPEAAPLVAATFGCPVAP